MDPIIYSEDNNESGMFRQSNYRERHAVKMAERGLIGKIVDAAAIPAVIWIVFILIMNFWLLSGYVPSESMEPAMMTGEYIIADRLAYSNGVKPARGDVIVFRHTSASQELLVKRVIGIGGDKVDLIGGDVYINGCLIDESEYAVGKTVALIEGKDHFEVPEGSVLVLGDNRENSADARYWEDPYLELDEIIGRVNTVYSLPMGQAPARFFTPVESKDIRFYSKEESEAIKAESMAEATQEKTGESVQSEAENETSTEKENS